MAKAGHNVIILQGEGIGASAVFDDRSYYRCSSLGTKRDGSVLISVCEGIHFLLYYIRGITNTAHEELGIFEGGCADLAVSVLLCFLAHNALYVSPQGGFIGKYVHCAFNLLNHFLYLQTFIFSLYRRFRLQSESSLAFFRG